MSEQSIALFPSMCRDLVKLKEPVDAVYATTLDGSKESVENIAERAMRRRVQQGEAEFRVGSFSGLPALEYIWSDGVARVVSWFVVREESIYEIQWTQPWLRQTGDETLAQEGQRVCEQFELRG